MQHELRYTAAFFSLCAAFRAAFCHFTFPPRWRVVQVFELMRGLDKDCDSTIDLHEFASRFEAVFTRLNAKEDVRGVRHKSTNDKFPNKDAKFIRGHYKFLIIKSPGSRFRRC